MKLINFAVLVLIALCQSASAGGIPQLKLLDPEAPVSTSNFPVEARNALNKYPTAIGYRFNPKALEQLARELPDKKLGDAYDIKVPNEKGEMLELRMHLERISKSGTYPSFGFGTTSRDDRGRGFGSATVQLKGKEFFGIRVSAILDELSGFSSVNYRVVEGPGGPKDQVLVSVSDTDPVYLRENAAKAPCQDVAHSSLLPDRSAPVSSASKIRTAKIMLTYGPSIASSVSPGALQIQANDIVDRYNQIARRQLGIQLELSSQTGYNDGTDVLPGVIILPQGAYVNTGLLDAPTISGSLYFSRIGRFLRVVETGSETYYMHQSPGGVPINNEGEYALNIGLRNTSSDGAAGEAKFGGFGSLGAEISLRDQCVVYQQDDSGLNELELTTFVHEVGHSMDARHSFNLDSSQREELSAVEPGFGSTIMSYGAAESWQVVPQGQLYSLRVNRFHSFSLQQMDLHLDSVDNDTNSSTVAVLSSPTVSFFDWDNSWGSFTVPRSTFFRLNLPSAALGYLTVDNITPGAAASGGLITTPDPELHPLFEAQRIINLASAATVPASRIFPSISAVIEGTQGFREVTPTYDRIFSLRVHQNKPVTYNSFVYGGNTWKDTQVTVSGNPFVVTTGNTSETWLYGEERDISWEKGASAASHVQLKYIEADRAQWTNQNYDLPDFLSFPNAQSFLIGAGSSSSAKVNVPEPSGGSDLQTRIIAEAVTPSSDSPWTMFDMSDADVTFSLNQALDVRQPMPATVPFNTYTRIRIRLLHPALAGGLTFSLTGSTGVSFQTSTVSIPQGSIETSAYAQVNSGNAVGNYSVTVSRGSLQRTVQFRAGGSQTKVKAHVYLFDRVYNQDVIPVTATLRDPNTNAYLGAGLGRGNFDERFAIFPPIDPALYYVSYKIVISAPGYLRKTFYRSFGSNGETSDFADIPMFAGDLDGSDEIDAADMDVVIGAFGTTPGIPGWNPFYDLDGTTEVDAADIDIIGANFGRVSDP